MEERGDIRIARRLSERIAKTIRVLSCPPIVITAMLLVLFLRMKGQLSQPLMLCATIALMAAVPALAYPLSLFFRNDEKRRAKQRKLAMALSVAGYAGSLTLGIIEQASPALLFVSLTYLLSVALLVLSETAFHIHASGHVCSATGAIVLSCLFLGAAAIVPAVIAYALVIWASISNDDHKPAECALGTVICLVSVGLAALMCGTVFL